MALEVMPLTEAGRRFTALAEEHARQLRDASGAP